MATLAMAERDDVALLFHGHNARATLPGHVS